MSSPPHSPAPTSREAVLSPDWLGWAIGADVRTVEVVDEFTTVATKVRLRLTVDGKASVEEHAVFVKAMLEHDPLPPFLARISGAEATFYRHVVAGVGIRHPRVRYSGVDPSSGHGLLLMDDLTAAGAKFLDVLSPYSREQAASSVDQLARLHASHWDALGLDSHPWIVDRFADVAAKPWRTNEQLAELLADGRAEGLGERVVDVDLIHRSMRSLAARCASKPQAMVHGDPHAGNVYEQDCCVSLIDWQMVQRTHWSIDVAYHVAASLSIEDRRSSERELLHLYLERLRSYGVDAPTFDEAFADYRAAMVYGLYMWAVTMKVARPITVALTQRLGAAVNDLETFDVLAR